MQFALHYMGQTEDRMRHFLHEVSRHLRVGGTFIATTMDSRVLLQLLMGHAEQSWVRDEGLGDKEYTRTLWCTKIALKRLSLDPTYSGSHGFLFSVEATPMEEGSYVCQLMHCHTQACQYALNAERLAVHFLCMTVVNQDSTLGRTTLKVEIEDERKHNLLSINVRHARSPKTSRRALDVGTGIAHETSILC